MKAEEQPEYQERTEQEIKELWQRKKFKSLKNGNELSNTPEDFLEWFKLQEQKCCYCGITEQEIALLHSKGHLSTKRWEKRGRRLELERKNPETTYDVFDNLALACMWCNNAKTDTFTYEEFIKVGKVFNQIWQDRLKNVSKT